MDENEQSNASISVSVGPKREKVREAFLRLGSRQFQIETMCEEINEKFKLPYGKVHELDGEFGVGKTQLCYSLMAKFLQSNPTRRAVWINRNRTLETEAFLRHYYREGEDATTSTQNMAAVLDRIMVISVEDRFEFVNTLKELLDKIASLDLRLVIVDDVDCSEELLVAMRGLQALAKRGLAVIITNHLTAGDDNRLGPMLGVAWAKSISSHIGIFRHPDNSREISFRERDGTVSYVRFHITDSGLFKA
ncbi:hypothetical protein WR25_21542 [Diploscapter pachys]|uniref:DNA recombination and repair protein Rad51-like C-terminal domain-containing protein n=1 Tax=Diploscapter pachys TaxID=2018661 RepID=A0A2A2JNH0_9BILA|nr:hypothetical protein WR25_21542 [Diploscapter pachys]